MFFNDFCLEGHMKLRLACTAQNYTQKTELNCTFFAKKDPKNRKFHQKELILHLKF